MSLPLTLTGQVSHSFDFPTHVFFVSHYQRNWWSLWEPRWFEGFDVSRYLPLTHQLAALVGLLVGDESAVSARTFLAAVVYPIAVFQLVRPYFGARTALAGSVAVVTSSVLLGGYAFGQLPTLFALDAGLFAASALSRDVRHGGLVRGRWWSRWWESSRVVTTALRSSFLAAPGCVRRAAAIGMLERYLWSLPTGRALFWISLGLARSGSTSSCESEVAND